MRRVVETLTARGFRLTRKGNAGIGLFSVTNLPGVVNFFVSEADVGGANQFFSIGRIASLADFAPILRRVILIGEAALGV